MVVLRGEAVSYERGTPVILNSSLALASVSMSGTLHLKPQTLNREPEAYQGYLAHKKQTPPRTLQ